MGYLKEGSLGADRNKLSNARTLSASPVVKINRKQGLSPACPYDPARVTLGRHSTLYEVPPDLVSNTLTKNSILTTELVRTGEV